MSAPPLTTELALRIERLIGHAALSQSEQSEDDSKVSRFGNTVAVKARGGRPRNKVFCFGHEDLHHLPAILAFYATDHLEPGFYLTPMGFTKEVAAALTAAGFLQHNFEQAILYGLPAPVSIESPASVTVERVTPKNLEAFVTATADGFEWPAAWRDAAMDDVRNTFSAKNYRFLVRFEGHAAGVGSLHVNETGVASLSAGAVVPEFRRKGRHLALVHHRLYFAHEIGCNFVLGSASFNSASFRNQQRGGLRLAYVESEWRR
ncbi:MAG TPA: GNAT family N-acetyltransferase [Bryobacteraceae bacterium]|jgi:GNAT superfamily N-acetyltransferase|nr:GNAT family N-acetyltransferase [Bryobacteraceae bacterium]